MLLQEYLNDISVEFASPNNGVSFKATYPAVD